MDDKLPHSECKLCRIAVENMSVQLDNEEQLHDISLHIHCGEMTVLVGPNGAGKTTLIRALLNQVPYNGIIHHLDQDARPFSKLRIGYVPQQLPFDRQMPLTVRDLLACTLSSRPIWTGVSAKTRTLALQTLSAAKAESLIDKRLGALSGGELQRVLLALALSPLPDLLILDEPVSGVDQNGQALFLDTVKELKKNHHMAVLLVSHDMELVRCYADRVLLLNKTILAHGSPDEVFRHPAFAEAFPASRHILEGLS